MYRIKTVDLSGIQTRIVGIQGEHALSYCPTKPNVYTVGKATKLVVLVPQRTSELEMMSSILS